MLVYIIYYNMANEYNILVSMYTDVSNNLQQIKTSKSNIQKIRNSITQMDTNYFDVKCDDDIFKKYLNMFDDNDDYNQMVDDMETLKIYLMEKIRNICKHEWVCDLVDITPDNSQHVCYCRLCEVSMK